MAKIYCPVIFVYMYLINFSELVHSEISHLKMIQRRFQGFHLSSFKLHIATLEQIFSLNLV